LLERVLLLYFPSGELEVVLLVTSIPDVKNGNLVFGLNRGCFTGRYSGPKIEALKNILALMKE